METTPQPLEPLTTIQVCSDIHFDDFPVGAPALTCFDEVLVPSAPVLCLAGDIGDPFSDLYADFLAFCSSRFEMVFLVAGNHEFFGRRTVRETHQQLDSLARRHANVAFLCKQSVVYRGVLFAGTTLWSRVPPKHMREACERVNDFKYIPEARGPHVTNAWHADQLAWLTGIIRGAAAGGLHPQPHGDVQRTPAPAYYGVVVVTHHPPSMRGTSLARYDLDPLRFSYRNELDHLVSSPGILAWVCGHTHTSFHQQRGRAQLVANQYRSAGYQRRHALVVRPLAAAAAATAAATASASASSSAVKMRQ